MTGMGTQRQIRVLRGATYLDSPASAHGVTVDARIDVEGWLRIEVTTDESVKGWALSYNGRDIPIYVEPAQRLQINSGPLEAVERRDNVTGIAAAIGELKKRTREDRLRVWLALGGTEDDFPEQPRDH